jgi:hypothetical protein
LWIKLSQTPASIIWWSADLPPTFYVEEAATDAGRLTKDVDITVRRSDLERIEAAVAPFGLRYRCSAGADVLVQADAAPERRAVRMVFTQERVREDSLEPTPGIGESRKINGIRLMPLEDLIRMKLTSFRQKDQVHIKDLQEAGLITPEIELAVPPTLLDRSRQVLQAA